MLTLHELAALQDGDNVILTRGGLGSFTAIGTVRLTPTQLVVTSPQGTHRFHRKTGEALGRGKWEEPILLQAYTEDAALRLRTARAVRRASLALDRVPHDTLETLTGAQCQNLLTQLTQVVDTLAAWGIVTPNTGGKR
jgi:hypothetical protein